MTDHNPPTLKERHATLKALLASRPCPMAELTHLDELARLPEMSQPAQTSRAAVPEK